MEGEPPRLHISFVSFPENEQAIIKQFLLKNQLSG
jgi:hypothetical protein